MSRPHSAGRDLVLAMTGASGAPYAVESAAQSSAGRAGRST